MEYDEKYKINGYFGNKPVGILEKFCYMLDKKKRILDIGIGQGRNTVFLARKNFQVDGIDLSTVAIELVSGFAAKEKLKINSIKSDFKDFEPLHLYSGILVFGLIQELSWESIHHLIEKMRQWTYNGGLVFITAFTTDDPGFSFYLQSPEWKTIGKNSFKDNHGYIRTYLEKGEIVNLFSGFRVIHHWEGMGVRHRHGNGPEEQHGMIELVVQK